MKKGTTLKLKRSILKHVNTAEFKIQFKVWCSSFFWHVCIDLNFVGWWKKLLWFQPIWFLLKLHFLWNFFFYHLCQKLCMCQNSDHSLCRRAAGKLKIKYSIRRKSKSITCFLTDFDSALKTFAKNNYVHFRA